MSPDQESRALQLNPFEGDRDVVYRVLRDGFVTTRCADQCMTCLGLIRPGDRVRSRVEKYEGKVYTFRFCEACCDAMASSWDDNGEAWVARAEIGFKRARRGRATGDREGTR